jgi:thiamine pyrophosphate-dependent acetolactate synthase large subunit-like protein
MRGRIDPFAVSDAVARAVARLAGTAGVFAEPSSAMFYLTRSLGQLGDAPYARFSPHYGCMGHGIGGGVGFCAATGARAVVLSGDGSLDLLSPMRTALKHGLLLTIVVLNDARLGLPAFGTAAAGLRVAHATTDLPPWDFTRQGSRQVGGWRVDDLAGLDIALAEALSWDACSIVDVQIDRSVEPPVGERMASVKALFCDDPPLESAA